jgi:hypothetical protein
MGNYKIWAAFALATIVFYFTPLFDSQTSIQGDAVDLHYSAQKYFADTLREGHLPYWTPFLYSGFPFLADPQTAAWYPPHWPFFLAGITPKAIEWELALHAFLALGGTYLLARRMSGDSMLALLAAVFYAGGGFFAAHSSRVGIFETAALLPWLLWSALRALEEGAGPSILLTGAIGGLIVLIGNFQATIYSFFALALFLAARRAPWKRAGGLFIAAGVVALLLGAIQILPRMELAAQSHRTAVNTSLKPAALATLVYPNFYGAISGTYSGPGDATQFYFYSGVFLLPLAIVGILKRRSIVALALILPALLYSFGWASGLNTGLNIGAPVDIWFVVALGFALAAGTGAAWLAERFDKSWLMLAILLVSVADLWYWNMADNQLAYASASFAEKYGDPYTNFQSHLAQAKQRVFTRIWAPFDTSSFGPLNSSLEGRTEVTYGYNPLELSRYSEYMEAAERNPNLLNGLAVTHGIDTQRGALIENSNVLPRIYAPRQIKFVASHTVARAMLATLDPREWAIVETPLRPLAPGATRVEIVDYTGDSYRARYQAEFDCLLRIAVPYFPGWTAAIDGKPTPVYIVDDALSGVFAPAGSHELTFRYRSNWFFRGALVTVLTLLGLILSSTFLLRRR